MTAQAIEPQWEYPIQFAAPAGGDVNRWWGLAWLGMLLRYILAIPHWIVLSFLIVGLCVVMLVGWIPILLYGRVPSLQVSWISELLKRATRVSAYLLLYPGAYPPLGIGVSGPVALNIYIYDRSISKVWGIPIVGVMLRILVLIPHLVVLVILALAAAITILVFWIPILVNGRYPALAMWIFNANLVYRARVTAYALLLPVPYPPFKFS
jgi:hypothetical protein